jgi:hypothetical protein
MKKIRFGDKTLNRRKKRKQKKNADIDMPRGELEVKRTKMSIEF